MAALLMAGVAFTSCSSDDDAIAEPQQSENAGPKTYTMTLKAGKGGEVAGVGGTRALGLDGHTLNATWSTTETVGVYFKEVVEDKVKLTHVGDLHPVTAGQSVVLSGTISGTFNVGDKFTLQFLGQSYKSQDGTLTGTDYSIDKTCDYATVDVQASAVSGGGAITVVELDARGDVKDPQPTYVTFHNQQAIICFSLKDDQESPILANSLDIYVGGEKYITFSGGVSGKSVYYLAVPGATSVIALNATVGDNTYSYTTGTAVTFSNGNYYEIPVEMTAD